MLASLVVYLKPRTGVSDPVNSGQALHAAFLSLVARVSPRLAAELHGGSPTKPFTLSCLQQQPERHPEAAPPASSGVFWFRVTTLTKPLFSAVDEALHGYLSTGESIQLGQDASFQIVSVQTSSMGRHSWSNLTSFSDLYELAKAASEITLQFCSPATFKQRAKNVPLPLPSLVFASYLQKWNAFSPVKFERASLLSWVEDNVAIEQHRIATTMVSFGRFRLVGFTGVCRYRALKDDTDRLKALNALADFAFYCGTGAKTTMGMGQTRRLK